MKKSMAALGLFLSLLIPVQADVTIDDLQVRKVGSNVSVRVAVRNPADNIQDGPVNIELFTRATSAEEWAPLKSWDDIKTITPGGRISRDYFDAQSTLLKDLAAKGRFQVKAVINAPGLRKTVEKISLFDTATRNF